MAIVFPRAMPLVGPADQVFEPMRFDFLSPEAGGRNRGMAAGFPLWTAKWTLGQSLSAAQSEEWRAWATAQRGATRLFLGRDYRRPRPLAYLQGFTGLTRAVGGAAFDGTATSWSQSIAADGQAMLTFNGLPAGFVFSTGDYVGFRWTTSGEARRSLVRALEGVVANGSGVAVLSVEPAVPALTPGSAVAYLDGPECLMRLVPKETEITAMNRRGVIGGRIVGQQDLLP